MSKKIQIFIVGHCILNTASKVKAAVGETDEERALHLNLLREALARDVQLLQLPCPELILYGSRRFGHVKEQFDHPMFREQCRALLHPVLMQLKEYAAYPDDYELLGVIGVDGSPSCGISKTCRGPWCGEVSMMLEDPKRPLDQLYMSPERGIFMDILAAELSKAGLDLPLLTAEQALHLLKNLRNKAETIG